MNDLYCEVMELTASFISQIGDKNFKSADSMFYKIPFGWFQSLDSPILKKFYGENRAPIIALRILYFLVYKYFELDQILFEKWIIKNELQGNILIDSSEEVKPIKISQSGLIIDNLSSDMEKIDCTLAGRKVKKQ